MQAYTVVGIVTIAVFVIAQAAQPSGKAAMCPMCTDGMDPDSCTGTQDCHHDDDICEFRVHLQEGNRVEYNCHSSHVCTNHESHSCDNADICSYCCASIDACKIQRDDLFTNTYKPGMNGTIANSTAV